MPTASAPAIDQLIAQLASSERRVDNDLHMALSQLARRIDLIERTTQALSASSGTSAGTATLVPKEFILTANLNVPAPSEAPQTVFLYIFCQDATGGWTLTWPAVFRGMPQPELTADTVSLIFAYKKSATLIVPATFQVGGQDIS